MSSAGLPASGPLFVMLLEGAEARRVPLDVLPFTIGRSHGSHLVLHDGRASRNHAHIVCESDGYYVVDQQSRRGTFVNGERVARMKLARGMTVHFGGTDGPQIIFDAERPESTAGVLLTQAAALQSRRGELAALSALLEVAQKLNTSTVLEDVIVTVLDKAIQLTQAERAYMFLRDGEGNFTLAAGRNQSGATLRDDSGISRSVVEEAAHSAREFLVVEEGDSSQLAGRMSVASFGLRSVICIPLRHRESAASDAGQVFGVLYLDSRTLAGRMSDVEQEVLRSLAGEVAILVENASLFRAHEQARRYEQELSIASAIQQRLMTTNLPRAPFARVVAQCEPCHQIGGDFYDAVWTPAGLSIVLADIAGKGISAALLASVLQGLAYSQLKAGAPLEAVAADLHAYLCEKEIGEKYATVLLLRVHAAGEVEMVNCGHLPPLIISGGKLTETPVLNPPVGLWPEAEFRASRCVLRPGDRLLAFTDGVTEASSGGDFFGSERVCSLAARGGSVPELLAEVRSFCGAEPPQDDCTVIEIAFTGNDDPPPTL